MNEETRPTLVIALWFLSTIVLAALFISSGIMGELTSAHILFAVAILALAVAGTAFILRKDNDRGAQAEKVKGMRNYDMLRSMSDDELIELKRRLSDIELNEVIGMNTLGDDGELVQRR